jgi:hypothetical protein
MRLRLLPLAAALATASGVAPAAMLPQPIAVLQGLDKTTARISTMEASVGTPAKFGTLSIVVRDCERSRPEDAPENAAFLEIYETPPGEKTIRLFSGWMFSSSPAISGLEHPVYDVELLECKGAAPPAPATPSPAPAAPAPTKPKPKTPR